MSSDSLLSPEHRRMLEQESGSNPEIIAARRYRTITVKSELEALGYFSKALREQGFRGDISGIGNSRILTLIIPGTRLVDVKRCLEALLADLDIRLIYEDTAEESSSW